ncbi:hypothetical protein SDJN02_10399, partial [Cucurbita argyrosperma subsp. argyrosperma]
MMKEFEREKDRVNAWLVISGIIFIHELLLK